MARGPVAPPPAPADVGVVAALPIEVAPFLARLKDVRKYSGERQAISEGLLGPKLVALIVTGPGRSAARRGAELLLAGHRPRWVVSAGFAGALDPALARNEVVFPDEVLDPEGSLARIGLEVHDEAAGPRIRAGRLATVDRIIRTAAEKAELRRETGADVVDMETAAVARLCAERGVRFVAARVVSDAADVDLPPEILTILGPTGGFRVGAAMGALWKRPSSVKDLLRLREHAHEAARRLGSVLAGVIERLP